MIKKHTLSMPLKQALIRDIEFIYMILKE